MGGIIYIYSHLFQIIKYYLSGLICFATDFLVTGLGISMLGLPPYVSHGIGWLVATGCNFQLNRMWVFGDQGRVRWKFMAFVALALFSLVCSTALLYLLNQIVGLPFYFAKLCAMLTVSLMNYLVVSRFIFVNRDFANLKKTHA
ncbi:GtrA family protein [Parapedobacter sp. 10938]|uniref:GtrA family protein n=1 Tax=Parapedobacter flavus TaxID=3110225 RepID=UPI002DB7C7EF|nr:GtrA family protein [Parapedobacter sp. 10938]MEC3881959.1 GtrA family protein [Parapedobacter sp. 10938]